MDQFITFVDRIGFPIAVAIFYMWKTDRTLNGFSKEIRDVAKSMDKLSKAVILLVLDDDNTNTKKQASELLNEYKT